MADMPWRREEAVRNALESVIYTIADVDLYSAIHDIIFDESTQIDWRRVEAILQERLPELELFGNTFESSAVTVAQLSEVAADIEGLLASEVLDDICSSHKLSPEDEISYNDAVKLMTDYYNYIFDDPESRSTNASCATSDVRAAFKKYAFY